MWSALFVLACVAPSSEPTVGVRSGEAPPLPVCVADRRLALEDGFELRFVEPSPVGTGALLVGPGDITLLVKDDKLVGRLAETPVHAVSWRADGSAVVIGTGTSLSSLDSKALESLAGQDLAPWFGTGEWRIAALRHAVDGDLMVVANRKGGAGVLLRLHRVVAGWELVSKWSPNHGTLGAIALEGHRVAVVVSDDEGDAVQVLNVGLVPLRVVRPSKPARVGSSLGLVGQGIVVGLSDGRVLFDLPGVRAVEDAGAGLNLAVPVVALEVSGAHVIAVTGSDEEASHPARHRVFSWLVSGTKLLPQGSWGDGTPVVGVGVRGPHLAYATGGAGFERRPDVVRTCDLQGDVLAGPVVFADGSVRMVVRPVADEGAGPSVKRWWVGW